MARISFAVRMAMAVAYSVAEEVKGNLMWGGAFLSTEDPVNNPVLLEYSFPKKFSDKIGDQRASVRFFFEGGLEVIVHILDDGHRNGDNWIEDWVVGYSSVRYYEYRDGEKNKTKTKEDWGSYELDLLKKKRPWWHPHVVSTDYYFLRRSEESGLSGDIL